MSWQPISTAPKDRPILLKICQRKMLTFFPDCTPQRIAVGYWCAVKNLTGEIVEVGWGRWLTLQRRSR